MVTILTMRARYIGNNKSLFSNQQIMHHKHLFYVLNSLCYYSLTLATLVNRIERSYEYIKLQYLDVNISFNILRFWNVYIM